ncbi:transcriptional regulator [bacterium DOLZORAL124_64_63]|nr:MAG: transcriptional regulator [bacterium DOLZORAL124_64_63]
MFSQTVEYAMRAVLALAAGDGSPMTTRQIAQTMKVPQSYLSKVLQSLVRGGLVFSMRGLKGGFVLTRGAEEITLLQILNCVQPLQRILHCPLDLKSHSNELCPLHRRLDEAMGGVEEAFAGTTLREILSEENPCSTLQRQIKILTLAQGDLTS